MFPLKDNIPLARFPLLTAALLVIDLVAYVLSIRHGGSFFGGPSKQVAVQYGAIPSELTHPGRHLLDGPATWKTVFSSLVLHGSFASLLTNMLALALFGPNVEDATGRPRFLVFFLLGGLLALGTHVLLVPNSSVPALATSGSIAAVLGGYLLLYPRAQIVSLAPIPFFATIVEIPAVLLIGLWWLAQLAFGLGGLADPLSGDWAAVYGGCLGGLLFGLLSIRLFASSARRLAKTKRTPHQPVY